jgi:hypothetical protein
MMQYMLLIYGNEQELGAEAAVTDMTPAYHAYAGQLREAGVLAGGARLKAASTATTVRVQGGQAQVLDGPFAETREQLGGYFLIEVPDLDAALHWAKRCPGAARGCVEVRPLWHM